METGGEFLCGLDEVGRGPLAGPVVAGACLLTWREGSKFSGKFSKDFRLLLECLRELGVTDSKKLSSTKREKILSELGIPLKVLHEKKFFSFEWENLFTIHCAVMEISVETIDQINILNASLKAMGDCFNLCNRLTSKKKGLVVVDGNKKIKDLPLEIDQAVLVKGDQKVALISLASILAKTYRDQIMEELNLIHPEYGWDRNAGYPTKLHREALRKQGPTPHHRKTFRGVFELL